MGCWLLTSYRLNNAHGKWEAANHFSLTMHEQTRWILGSLCSLFPSTDENKERIAGFRRLLVLSGVILLMFSSAATSTRARSSTRMVREVGLIKEEEFTLFDRKTTYKLQHGGQ